MTLENLLKLAVYLKLSDSQAIHIDKNSVSFINKVCVHSNSGGRAGQKIMQV
jgi:hypothetical protein